VADRYFVTLHVDVGGYDNLFYFVFGYTLNGTQLIWGLNWFGFKKNRLIIYLIWSG